MPLCTGQPVDCIQHIHKVIIMIFAIIIGLLSAVVLIIVMSRFGIKYFMGYPAVLDIVATILLMLMLHGTYVGMVAAVMGGLFISGFISVIRRVMGYARLTRVGYRLAWVDYPPTFTLNNMAFRISPKWACIIGAMLIILISI